MQQETFSWMKYIVCHISIQITSKFAPRDALNNMASLFQVKSTYNNCFGGMCMLNQTDVIQHVLFPKVNLTFMNQNTLNSCHELPEY